MPYPGCFPALKFHPLNTLLYHVQPRFSSQDTGRMQLDSLPECNPDDLYPDSPESLVPL